MTGYSERLTPEESARRKAEVAKITKLATRHGFRTVAGRPGCFFHPDIGQQTIFEWSERELDCLSDLFNEVYFRGLVDGQRQQKTKLREALGL